MRRHYFFHDGSDFFKWYRAYLSSKELIRVYKYYYSDERKRDEYEKFKEAEEIVDEYKTFICSLSENDINYSWLANYFYHDNISCNLLQYND